MSCHVTSFLKNKFSFLSFFFNLKQGRSSTPSDGWDGVQSSSTIDASSSETSSQLAGICLFARSLVHLRLASSSS